MRQIGTGPIRTWQSLAVLAGLLLAFGCQSGSAPASPSAPTSGTETNAPSVATNPTEPNSGPTTAAEPGPATKPNDPANGEPTPAAGPEYLGAWRIQVSADMRKAAEEQLKKSETSYRNSGLSEAEVKEKMDEARRMIGGVLDGTRLLLSKDATFRLDSGGFGISGRFASSGPQLTLYPDPSTAPSGETAGLAQSGPIELTYDAEKKQLRGVQGNAPVVFERAQ